MHTSLSRRQFLAGAAAVGAAGALARPIGLLEGVAEAAQQPAAAGSKRILVLCTLYGGNDGLNTVAPYEDAAYYDARSNIALPANSLLPLADGFGLNPALPGFKRLWDAGHLAIVRGVGYPNGSLSHFQSMSIWQTASPTGDVSSGWLGRWLDRTGNDPLRACSVGPTVLPAMAGERAKAAAVQDATSGSAQLPYVSTEVLAAYRLLQRQRPGAGALVNEITAIGHEMLITSKAFANALDHKPSSALPKGVTDGDIGTQLGVVSSLIRSGMPTKAYAVTQNGYDTHAGEPSTQTELLRQLDTATTAFFSSLVGSPAATGTTLVVYTEFGRRVASNGSDGTDHGTANNVYVMGPSVTGGFYGDPPDLRHLDGNGNLLFQTDFRSVYATLLERVIGVDPRSFLGKSYPRLSFV